MFKAHTSAGFEVPRVSMEAIGGYEEVKAELGQALQLISRPDASLPAGLLRELMPRGFIFHGPSGTGKTLLANAIASDLRATIMTVSGPVILNQMVAVTERGLQRLFAQARHNAPAVLVFEDIDSIAPRADSSRETGELRANALVAVLLAEMDRSSPQTPVLVIGTTHRLEALNGRLLTPGPFRPISVGIPDHASRRHIARIHASYFGITTTDELLDEIAHATKGMTGADIRSVFRQAAADELLGGNYRPDATHLRAPHYYETVSADDVVNSPSAVEPATATACYDETVSADDVVNSPSAVEPQTSGSRSLIVVKSGGSPRAGR